MEDEVWNAKYPRPVGNMKEWGTCDFLNELMHVHGAKTDYALHKLLKCARQTIYRYRDNRGTFDDEIAIRVAGLLKIDPALMLVFVARDRARLASARQWWIKILERLTATAVAVLVVTFGATLLSIDPPASASTASPLYIMSNCLALWLALYLLLIAKVADAPLPR